MKLREIFGLSSPETRPKGADIGNPEKGSEAVEETMPNEITALKLKYHKELKDYEQYTMGEIMKIENEFQEKIKNANPEEIRALEEEKTKKQNLLMENLNKVGQNLFEGLESQARTMKK